MNVKRNSIQVVLFDAVGTLLQPYPRVIDVYHRAGHHFGSRLSVDVIDQRFRQAFQRHYVAAGLNTSETMEQLRWRSVVAEVFSDIEDVDRGLFTMLWNHFSMAKHWQVFDDVAAALRVVQRHHLQVGIASNFDMRLKPIASELLPMIQSDHVFCSSSLGYNKPHQDFFRTIEEQLRLTPEQILLVGDDGKNDFCGATKAGWHALLIDRHRMHAEANVLHSLEELKTWFDERSG